MFWLGIIGLVCGMVMANTLMPHAIFTSHFATVLFMLLAIIFLSQITKIGMKVHYKYSTSSIIEERNENLDSGIIKNGTSDHGNISLASNSLFSIVPYRRPIMLIFNHIFFY